MMSGNCIGQNLDNISFGTDSTLDVVTWNIEWFPKNGTYTVDSVSQVIQSIDADLIGLQEIDDTTVCRQMINNLPEYGLFMDDEWFGGLAYVYKTSSVNIQSIYKIYDTAPYWNAFPRSPLVMEFTFMEEEFIVINNHFKCCGDGQLDSGNTSDEEARRYEANMLLKEYIELNFPSSRVIVLGDLNDILTDDNANNVFQMFLEDPTNFMYADEQIANGSTTNWSFPGWPSHLDHILITNEIFSDFSDPTSGAETLIIDDYMTGGLSNYDFYISDHRPVGIKLKVTPTAAHIAESTSDYSIIYPNPTNELISINLTDCITPVTIKIHDTNGKLVHTEICSESQIIDINIDLQSGIYFVIIESESSIISNTLFVK